MLGGSVIKVVSCCKINYFGHFSTIIEDFDWTNTVGEVKGSFFSWSFLPWWPKSTKSHDLFFENSITGATGARNFFVHVNLPKPISVRSNRISFKEWGLFLTMPPPKKYFWALRRAVNSPCWCCLVCENDLSQAAIHCANVMDYAICKLYTQCAGEMRASFTSVTVPPYPPPELPRISWIHLHNAGAGGGKTKSGFVK